MFAFSCITSKQGNGLIGIMACKDIFHCSCREDHKVKGVFLLTSKSVKMMTFLFSSSHCIFISQKSFVSFTENLLNEYRIL